MLKSLRFNVCSVELELDDKKKQHFSSPIQAPPLDSK